MHSVNKKKLISSSSDLLRYARFMLTTSVAEHNLKLFGQLYADICRAECIWASDDADLETLVNRAVEWCRENVISLYKNEENDFKSWTLTFTVTKEYLQKYLDSELTVEEFLCEYTSDDSKEIYNQALLDNAILMEYGNNL